MSIPIPNYNDTDLTFDPDVGIYDPAPSVRIRALLHPIAGVKHVRLGLRDSDKTVRLWAERVYQQRFKGVV